MSLTSVGDQGRLFLARQMTTQPRSEIERLTGEVASGRKAGLGTDTTRDSAQVLGIRRDLTTLAAYRTAVTEAGIAAKTAQAALAEVSRAASEPGPALVAAALSRSGSEIAAAASDARARFQSVVQALNSDVTGRALFAGTVVDQPALRPADQILAQLELAIAGQTTAAGIDAVLQDWFHQAGGGFETFAWTGNSAATSFRVGAGEEVGFAFTAAEPALREVMRGLAMAALAPGLADVTEQAAQMEQAGNTLLSSTSRVVGLRGEVGTLEAAIETQVTRIASETSALQLAESRLLGVDPYDASVALDAAATRLETLYAITARLSRLHLSEYLR